jgi:hypothetical protein
MGGLFGSCIANKGVITLNQEEAAKLAKTDHDFTLSMSQPDKQLYSLSMYQQLRCLNTIRKSFSREKFYPDLTDDGFQYQKSRLVRHPSPGSLLT